MSYIEQYKILHEIKPNYGKTSIKFLNVLSRIIKKNNFQSILDYGCGKSILIDTLKKRLSITTFKYDPAIHLYKDKPKQKFDLVICTDVLQHIPLDDLENVLKDISIYGDFIFFHIRTTFYKTILPNGDPANCTVFPKEWWEAKLSLYFKNLRIINYNSDSVTLTNANM